MSQSYMVPQKLFATFHITTAVVCLCCDFCGLPDYGHLDRIFCVFCRISRNYWEIVLTQTVIIACKYKCLLLKIRNVGMLMERDCFYAAPCATDSLLLLSV